VNSPTNLLPALQQYWGYDSFRRFQESIIQSLLDAHDTCVVMPTGGGKSLCYQLPAAITPGKTVIVISPLIALMQDQVAQLDQMGIPAALLNSSVAQAKQSKIMRDAIEGKYRLLYLSPERIARADSRDWLKRVPISFFAIDEAHCISEWGHEFRPEYRQLSRLREQFPKQPIAAFTASATKQVRHDIIEQLRLRDPDKYIASFYRPNLRYVMRHCDPGIQPALLVKALKSYAGKSVIVYLPTINRVEETVHFLSEQGISAIPYHAKLSNVARQKNQELWMSDKVRVLVGTIAFGLGIDKAAVRAVIHLSLPKSIEQYYQEAGRAGRDGEPADCIVLWQKRDAALIAYFIGRMRGAEAKARAWELHSQMLRFAESAECRHRQVCSHFGEEPKWKSCEACDACGYLPAWLPKTTVAQAPKQHRFATATAVPPIQPSSPGTAEPKQPPQQPVLRVAPSDPLYRGGTSAQISTAKPKSASAPSQQPSPRPEQRRSPRSEPRGQSAAKPADPELREYMREWRRSAAKEKDVPAFVVLHDTSLDELCRIHPKTLQELRRVHGFGEHKTAIYGPGILDALTRFRNGARVQQAPMAKSARA
jgi:ATP-dependent DNA helicase RecQ